MYSKLINKIITILAIISFLGIQIMPAVSMAAEEINQNIATNEENVKFNATLNGTGSYTMEADLSQNPTIDFEINVEKTGYLKNIVKYRLKFSVFKLFEVEFTILYMSRSKKEVKSWFSLDFTPVFSFFMASSHLF